jgi:hypothetical protein
MITVVETLHEPGADRPSEDELLVTSDLLAVFDGATGLVPDADVTGETGGRIAARLTAQTFAAGGDAALKAMAVEANRRLLQRMRVDEVDLDRREARWATALAAVRLHDEEIEYLTIGNCLVLALFVDGGHRLLTPHVDHDRQTLLAWRSLVDAGVPEVANQMKDRMVAVRRDANRSYGYLNGDPEAVEFLVGGRVPREGIESLLLFTEGLQLPREDVRQEPWDDFVRLYRERGLLGLLGYVRDLERSDPGCRRFPRFKQYDDAAAVAVRLVSRGR